MGNGIKKDCDRVAARRLRPNLLQQIDCQCAASLCAYCVKYVHRSGRTVQVNDCSEANMARSAKRSDSCVRVLCAHIDVSRKSPKSLIMLIKKSEKHAKSVCSVRSILFPVQTGKTAERANRATGRNGSRKMRHNGGVKSRLSSRSEI